MTDAIRYLLFHQCITSTALSPESHPRVWRVIKGSGVGCRPRREISEEEFILTKDNIDIHRIKLHCRYKDNIFLVLNCFSGNLYWLRQGWHNHRQSMKSDSAVEKWEISNKNMSYLDLTFYKGPRWEPTGVVDVSPCIKQQRISRR